MVSALTGEEDPKCNPNGTFRVDEDGKCVCLKGFSGKTCRERCEDGTYGIDPSDQANCKRKSMFGHTLVTLKFNNIQPSSHETAVLPFYEVE